MSSGEETIPKEEIKNLPNLTGVYMMKDSRGKIIYVGKAKNISKRVRSYFKKNATDPKTSVLAKKVRSIEYLTTENEVEALVLECNLIKENRPTYNVRLKDDKKYPYIKLTVKEKFPRLILVRNIKNDGSEYFGPYTDTGAVRKTLSMIGDIFPLRRCSNNQFRSQKERECLYFQIGKCSAPCTGRIEREEYLELAEQVKLLLSGKNSRLISMMEKRMGRLSSRREYEKAARVRDQIQSVKKVYEKQIAFEPGGADEDIVALAREKNLHCAVLMKVREGRILSSESFVLPASGVNSIQEVADSFIKLYYHSSSDIPPNIYVQTALPDKNLLMRWLKERTGRNVVIKIPHKGKKKKLLELARTNALIKLLQSPDAQKDDIRLLEDVKKTLGLISTPVNVEGYDISNIQGSEAVGSMVSFRNGRPDKKGYRHFKIRTVEGSDDFAMMSEVIMRRFGNLGSYNITLPDMILIDGGKGQVNAAAVSLEKIGIYDIPVVGLAKKYEKIHLRGVEGEITLPSNSNVLKFLQRIRDEAHRFAVKYHRRLRSKRFEESELDKIPGIGETRKMLLLVEFGSVERISTASKEEIASLPGIGGKLAQKITEYLKSQ